MFFFFFQPKQLKCTYRWLPLCRLRVARYYHWFFIPNIFSLYIFPFQLRLCRKRLTWNYGYLEMIFHALDVFPFKFATAFVKVKTWHSRGRRIVCLGLICTCITWGANIFQTTVKNKVIYLLLIEQLLLYVAKSITVLIRNQTQYHWSVTTWIISCLHLIVPL